LNRQRNHNQIVFDLDQNGIYYSNLNLPGMTKTWPNVNPRFGPKPVSTDFEAHAVSATAYVIMTYTLKAKVKDAEPSGTNLFPPNKKKLININVFSSSLASFNA